MTWWRERARRTRGRGSTCRSISPISRPGASSCGSIIRSTRTPSCIRWCACNSSAAFRRRERRAFLFTNVVDGSGRRYDMPVVVGAIAASAEIYSLGMRRAVGEIGAGWMAAIANPIPPVRVAAPQCQEVVITGDALRAPDGGMKLFPVPISTPGFDAAPYLTATLCITKDPDSGIQNIGTYRAALKATDRLVVRMVARAGGAGGFLHWQKYQERKEPMPIAIVIGAAPVVMFTGAQKLATDLDEIGRGGRARRPRACRSPNARPSISMFRPIPRSSSRA